jgi:hypothetical protein
LNSESKSAELLEYVLGTARANHFLLGVPEYAYPFGRDLGAPWAYSVRLSSSEIECQHSAYKQYSVVFNLIDDTSGDVPPLEEWWQFVITDETVENMAFTISGADEVQFYIP